jgi:hypothetical protein
MVICNAVRYQVGSLVLLVWISNQRQADGKVKFFASVYLILVPGKKFIVENKYFGEHKIVSLKKVNSKPFWRQ